MPEVVLLGRDLHLALRRRGASLSEESRVCALDGVNVALRAGEVVGVVGASGAGKSSLVRVLACLASPDKGEVWWGGQRVDNLPEGERRAWRRQVQLVFQDPGSSFNPKHSVGFALREAARVGLGLRVPAARAAVVKVLQAVGFPSSQDLGKRIHEFSGGQKQRLALARALLVQPKALLLDEPVASLDAPLRRQFLRFLQQLVEAQKLAALVVTHDFRFLEGLAQRVLVLLAGKVVEEAPWPALRQHPRHPYTLALLQAAAGPRPQGEFLRLAPSGCAFRLLCPRASSLCLAEPPAQELGAHRVACHHPLEENPEGKNFVETRGEGG